MYTYYQQKLLQLHYQADNVTWRQDIIYVTGMAIKSNRKSNKSLQLVSLGSVSGIQPWSILDEVVRDAMLGSDLKAGGAILTSAPSNRRWLCCLLLGTRFKTFQGEIFQAWNMELGMKVLTLAYSLEALQSKVLQIRWFEISLSPSTMNQNKPQMSSSEKDIYLVNLWLRRYEFP